MEGPMRSGSTERSHRDLPRRGRSRTVVLSIATIGLVAASVLISSARGPVGASPSQIAGVVGAHRVVRARLSGGYAYAPCRAFPPNDRLVDGLVCDEPVPSSWPES